MSSGSDELTLTAWCPDTDLAQSLGSDGSDGDDKYRWSGLCVKGPMSDGEGNSIDFSEAIRLLVALKNSQG